MKVGICYIQFHLHGNRSLKGKRQVVRTLKDRLKNKFNVSVAEVGDQDVWQTLQLGIAAVSADGRYLEGLLQQLVEFIDNLHLAEMTHHETRLLHVGNETP